jgi:putative toxin-antitoxin system antitoxin component (TIGR02293 family)
MTSDSVAAMLGGPAVLGEVVQTDLELVAQVRQGLPSASLQYVANALKPMMTREAVYAVVGSERTLQRKQKTRERLSAAESDRLARLARVAVRAEEALGSHESAIRWLVANNRALGGQTPLELLHTDAGTVLVEDVLERIEHGVVG